MVQAVVIHHGNNNAYYAWRQSSPRDIIIDESICARGVNYLGKWIEVSLDGPDRARSVTIVSESYPTVSKDRYIEINVDIVRDRDENYLSHRLFGRISDPNHLITRLERGARCNVWITSQGGGREGTYWIVNSLNEPLPSRFTDAPRRNEFDNSEYYDRSSSPERRGFDQRGRGFDGEDRSGSRSDWNPDGYRIQMSSSSGNYREPERMRSPSVRHQDYSDHRDERRNYDFDQYSRNRSPIRNSNSSQSSSVYKPQSYRQYSSSPERGSDDRSYANSYQGRRSPASQTIEKRHLDDHSSGRNSHVESDRFSRKSSPARSHSTTYKSEPRDLERRGSTKSSNASVSGNSNRNEVLERTQSRSEATSSVNRGMAQEVNQSSDRATFRRRNSANSRHSNEKADTTDSEEINVSYGEKSVQDMPLASSSIKGDDTSTEHSAEVSNPVVNPEVLLMEKELKKYQSRLLQIKRLFKFFTEKEDVALPMQFLNLDKFEYLEDLLNSIPEQTRRSQNQ